MNDPVRYEFFCSEADYPQFGALFPDRFPATYEQFVARVDKRIQDRMEQVTITKANVGFDEFISYCKRSGEIPNYDTLLRCAFLAWGYSIGGRSTHEQ